MEAILSPSTKKDDKIQELEKEIDIGMESSISPRSHKEIFDRLQEEYGAC